jgi:hypothetical protein
MSISIKHLYVSGRCNHDVIHLSGFGPDTDMEIEEIHTQDVGASVVKITVEPHKVPVVQGSAPEAITPHSRLADATLRPESRRIC